MLQKNTYTRVVEKLSLRAKKMHEAAFLTIADCFVRRFVQNDRYAVVFQSWELRFD